MTTPVRATLALPASALFLLLFACGGDPSVTDGNSEDPGAAASTPPEPQAVPLSELCPQIEAQMPADPLAVGGETEVGQFADQVEEWTEAADADAQAVLTQLSMAMRGYESLEGSGRDATIDSSGELVLPALGVEEEGLAATRAISDACAAEGTPIFQ